MAIKPTSYDQRLLLVLGEQGEDGEWAVPRKKILPLSESAAKEAKRPQAAAFAPEVSASASSSSIIPAEELPCMKKKNHYQFE